MRNIARRNEKRKRVRKKEAGWDATVK